jgi:hypothetical protein
LNPYAETGGKKSTSSAVSPQAIKDVTEKKIEDQHAFIVLGKCNSDDGILNRVSNPGIKKRSNKHVQIVHLGTIILTFL